MRNQMIFESKLEKLARILARQYGINVVFEGNIPCTDGKTIYMPIYQDMDAEMMKDYEGFLDHECAHCKFTKMDELKKCISEFHNLFLQNIEDYRIEKEMQKEFPGTALNLIPLNDKLRGKMNEDWEKRPWPLRFLTTVRDITEGRPYRIDDDFKKYMDLIEDEMKELPGVKSTTEVREITERIVRKVVEEYEKSGGAGEDLEKYKGPKKKSKSGSGEGKGEKSEGRSDKDGDESDSDSDGEDEPKPGKPGDKIKKMLTAKKDSGAKDFVIDVEGMIEESFSEHAEEEEKKTPSRMDYRIEGKGVKKVTPVTTRYDSVTDHSGKGNPSEYARSKREAMPLVSAVKLHLERVLKVKENAKWRTERERGAVNPRSLAQLASNKGYREIFREFTKTETNNVAVQVLVDMSGSMSGRIHIAKQAAVAMAEALGGLGIAFEVTGFYSISDHRVASVAASMPSTGRFSRSRERLDLHVFKSFESNSLIGISKMHVGSQNPDGECLAWAAKRLSMQRQKRKILFVLSDGQPATGDTAFGILQSDLRARIAECGKVGIEVIGIGIETDYVKNFYPDYVILKDARDLPKQAMGKIAKMLEKGK